MHRTLSTMTAAAALAAACGGELGQSSVIDTVGGTVDAPTEVAQTTLHEWSIGIAADTVSPGTLMFRVHNGGTMHHALEIEGAGIERKTEPLPQGERAELVVDLKPGTYTLYCPLESPQGTHRALGMSQQLVVR